MEIGSPSPNDGFMPQQVSEATLPLKAQRSLSSPKTSKKPHEN